MHKPGTWSLTVCLSRARYAALLEELARRFGTGKGDVVLHGFEWWLRMQYPGLLESLDEVEGVPLGSKQLAILDTGTPPAPATLSRGQKKYDKAKEKRLAARIAEKQRLALAEQEKKP